MIRLISFLRRAGDKPLSVASSFDELVEYLLGYREGKHQLDEGELFALRFWILKKACVFKPDEIKSICSTEKPEIEIVVGKNDNKTVYVDDSEEHFQADVSEIAWL